MTLEEVLKKWEQAQPMLKGTSLSLTREEVIARYNDPAFQEKRKIAQMVQEVHNEHDRAFEDHRVDNESLFQEGNSRLYRFTEFHYVEDKTAEGKELNKMFTQMYPSPEGQQYLADTAIRNIFGHDLSFAYQDDENKLLQELKENPTLTDQMWIASHLEDSNLNFELHPMVKEMIEYNASAYEQASDNQTTVRYYSSDVSYFMKDVISDEDFAALVQNGPDAKKNGMPSEAVDEIQKRANELYSRSEERKKRAGLAELKKEGIIGKDSIFYRAYDENNNRIPLKNAIDKRCKGEKVEFRKMSPEEQEQLKEAIKNPTVFTRKVGALSGKDFQKDCKDLYTNLDNVDSAFIRSSPTFRSIKSQLKEMAGRKTAPTAEESKKTTDTLIQSLEQYIKDKKAEARESAPSQYAIDRTKAAVNVLNALRAKRFAMDKRYTFAEYKQKLTQWQNSRQAGKGNAHEARERINEKAAQKAPETIRPVAMTEAEAKTPFDRLAVQYNKGLKLAQASAAPNAAADPNLSNGRYAAMIVAYKLVENERATVPNGPGPLEQTLNEVGSKAFYKGVQGCEVMQTMVKGGITGKIMQALMQPETNKAVVARLSQSKKNLTQVRDQAKAYCDKQKDVQKAEKTVEKPFLKN